MREFLHRAYGVTCEADIFPRPAEFLQSRYRRPFKTKAVSQLSNAPGLFSEAEGSVEIQVSTSGLTGLEVEVKAIPAGTYDFIVGGVNRGTLSVIFVKGKLRGKLRYEIDPDSNDELLLDFTVAGESIVISQRASTFFSGAAPVAN
jgi:hypothetical protein